MTLRFSSHAIKEMFADNISEREVREVLTHGEIVRTYPEDKPYPSRLVLGFADRRPIHVVAADGPAFTIVITTYRPDPDLWEQDYKTRKHS